MKQAVSEQEVITSYDYAAKYTRAGPIKRLLIDRFYAELARLVPDEELDSTLEVGCGEGFSTARLRELLPGATRLAASDVERRLVSAAVRRNPGIPITQESIYRLQRDDASWDLVVCLEVLEHLDEPERAMRELTRVCRGYLLVSVPQEPLWRLLNLLRLRHLGALGNSPGHLQHWSRRGFVGFLGRFCTPLAVASSLPWTIVLARVRHIS